MPGKKKYIFISAGEQSGDIHASALINELKKHTGDTISFTGLGGDNLANEGVELLFHTKELATIGLWDVAKKYRFFQKVLKNSIDKIRETQPAAIILVDYPGFNLKLAEEARKFFKEKIIYYIAPQVWAWNSGRTRKMKKYLDKVLVVFPFEVEFYKRFGINAIYTGHPLVRRIRTFIADNPKLKQENSKKVISILPGSRISEIIHHMPVLIDTARELKKELDAHIIFSRASSLPESAFNKFKKELDEFELSGEESYKLIMNSDAVLAKAGTSTIECSLFEVPCLIFYKTNIINYGLLKPFVKVDNLGMVNILAEKNIVKEFIQKDFTKEKLMEETKKLLTNESYRNEMINEFRKIRKILGEKDSSENASQIILKELKFI